MGRSSKRSTILVGTTGTRISVSELNQVCVQTGSNRADPTRFTSGWWVGILTACMALVMAFLAMVGCNHPPRLRNLRRHAMPVGFMITLVLLGVLVILALIRLRYFGSRLFI